MKFFLFFFILAGSCNIHEPELNGAFENVIRVNSSLSLAKNDSSIHSLTIFKNGYWIRTSFEKDSLFKCCGGTYKIMNNKCIQTYNFSSQDSSVIGKTDTFTYNFKNNKYLVEVFFKNVKYNKYNNKEEYHKITTTERLKDSSLEGVWQMPSGQVGFTTNFDEGIRIYAYPCFTGTFYNAKQKRFIVTFSGTYQFDGENLIETIKYSSSDISLGTIREWNVKKLSDNQIQLFDIDSFYDEEIYNLVQ